MKHVHGARRATTEAMVIVVLLSAALLPGCAGNRNDVGPEDPDLDALRALSYVDSVDVDPDERSGVVFIDDERSQPGYTLYTVQMLSRAVLIDARGEVLRRWSHEPSARWERAELLPGGDLLAIGAEPPPRPVRGIPDDVRYLIRFDRDGAVRFKRKMLVHHDIEETPDGRLLALTFKRRKIRRIHPEIDIRDDYLTLLDQEGNVLEELSLLEAFSKRPEMLEIRPVGASTLGVVPWIDLFHVNSVESMRRPELVGRHPIFDPRNVLICSRHQNAIAVINWERREPVWAWGRGELLGPHDARVVANGHLLIFDNGMGRGWSRVIELDPVSETIVWEYRATPPESFYTLSKGSSQRLPNGNTLIADSDNGRAFEVTHGGEIVWDFRSPQDVVSGKRAAIVRAIRYDAAFVEPITRPSQEP